MRNTNFISPRQSLHIEKVFNATGQNMSVFDDAINQIQKDIDDFRSELFGDHSKGIPSKDNQIAAAYQNLISARDNRDQAPKRSNHPDRVYWSNQMNKYQTEYYDLINQKTNLQNAISKLQTVDLPAAISLKEKHAKELYDQSFANKGIDVQSQRKIKEAEAEAIRLAAQSKAMVEQAMQKTASEISTQTSKTTRNIIILIVVAAIITSTIIIIRKRKK